MSQHTQGRVSGKVRQVVQELNQSQGLAFKDVLSEQEIREVLLELGVTFRQRIFTPIVTVWVFLTQVLSADHSCREAVAKFIAFLTANDQKPCSAKTSSYCEARRRLPSLLLERLARAVGHRLDASSPSQWLWKGRSVKMVDGSTVSMPDTKANQAAYPQASTQKPGLGFPIARIVALFSLSCGSILEFAMGPYKGKQTGEVSLFCRFLEYLSPGDVIIGDRVYGSYFDIAMLQQRGVDIVVRKHQLRSTDFRRGRRLGKHDHLIIWDKPGQCPDWMEQAIYQAMPDQLLLREVKVEVREKGMRCRSLMVVSTLLDADAFTSADLAQLYRARWHVELDLRSLKSTMQMDVLRGKTPDMVGKEIWAHLLAYNLIRTVMAQSAEQYQLLPREISFKATLARPDPTSHRGAKPCCVRLLNTVWPIVPTESNRVPSSADPSPTPYSTSQELRPESNCWPTLNAYPGAIRI